MPKKKVIVLYRFGVHRPEPVDPEERWPAIEDPEILAGLRSTPDDQRERA